MLYQSNQRRLRHTSPLIHFITLALLSPVMCRLPCRCSTVSQPLSSRALFHLSPCLCVLVCVCMCAKVQLPATDGDIYWIGLGGGGSGEYGHSPTYSNLRHAEMNVSKTRTQNESSTPQLDISLIHRPPSLQSPGYHMSTLTLHRRLSPCHSSPASLADLQRTGQLRWARGRGRSGQNGKWPDMHPWGTPPPQCLDEINGERKAGLARFR